jgi:hypothetical protein
MFGMETNNNIVELNLKKLIKLHFLIEYLNPKGLKSLDLRN